MKNYILTIDLGGTTFSSYIISEELKIIEKSKIDKIGNYASTSSLLEGISSQTENLINSLDIPLNNILCASISAPGPLDSKLGLILNTPNLNLLKNVNIVSELSKRLRLRCFLENDANLFSWGEWYQNYRNSNVFIGITLGTGLGIGIIINGKLFLGEHGMAAEYGISPLGDGVWESKISIKSLEEIINHVYKKKYSPKDLFLLAEDGDANAINIWNTFGKNIGIMSSHLVNMLDPCALVYGGGLSRAFDYFKQSIKQELLKYSPSYSYNKILIKSSKDQLSSIHIGAFLLAKESLKK